MENEQGGATRELMNAFGNTTLILIGCCRTTRTTATETKRFEPDFVQLGWADAKGPDGKVSCYTGCPATQAWTLVCYV